MDLDNEARMISDAPVHDVPHPTLAEVVETVRISRGISVEESGAAGAQLDLIEFEIVDDTPELNNLVSTKDDPAKLHLRAPAMINGIAIQALVDSGANKSFISTRLVEKAVLTVIPTRPGSMFNRGGIDEPRVGSVRAELHWADKKESVRLEVIDHSGEDLLIGTDLWELLGITIAGVPVKPPGPEVTDVDDFLPLSVDDGPDTDLNKLDPRLREALAINAKIDAYSVCTHPLAPLTLRTTEPVTYWRRVNFIKHQDMKRAREIIQEWIQMGVLAKGVPTATACFALLVVPKKDDFGKQTDIRLCIDMGPGNKFIKPDLYPLPLINDILEVAMIHRERQRMSTPRLI